MITTLNTIARLLRKNRGELSPAESRVLKAGLSGIGQACFKGTQILVTIASVPLMLTYLGKETFGLTMAIMGFTQWFLTDTGVAEGVKMRLVECLAADDREAAKTYVSTGFFVMLLLAILAGVAFAFAYPRVPWENVFNVSSDAVSVSLSEAILASFFVVMLVIPLKIYREIYTADQRGYVFFLIMAAGTAASLLGIIIAVRLDLGLVGIVLAVQGCTALAHLACAVCLFLDNRPWLLPRWSHVRFWAWRNMWSDSLVLLFIGMSLMVINGTDVFVVNLYLGGSEAAAYSLSLRIFLYVQVIASFLTYPAWPAIGDAVQRGEQRWARRAARLLVGVSVAFGVVSCALLVITGRSLLSLWSRGQVTAGQSLLLLLALYIVLRIWSSVFGILLRTIGRVRNQGLATAAEALLHVGLGILLVQRMGLIGIAVGSVASIVLTRAWALPLEYFLATRSPGTICPAPTNLAAEPATCS